jgi:hypothetical protein
MCVNLSTLRSQTNLNSYETLYVSTINILVHSHIVITRVMIEGHTLYSNEFVMCHYFIILINLNLVWKVCPTPDLKLMFEFL